MLHYLNTDDEPFCLPDAMYVDYHHHDQRTSPLPTIEAGRPRDVAARCPRRRRVRDVVVAVRASNL